MPAFVAALIAGIHCFDTLSHLSMLTSILEISSITRKQSNYWPCVLFEVSCQQFYRCVFWNHCLWGKSFLCLQGIFLVGVGGWPLEELTARMTLPHHIHFSGCICGIPPQSLWPSLDIWLRIAFIQDAWRKCRETNIMIRWIIPC